MFSLDYSWTRLAFKEALNRQTYPQFKAYAEQQYPNSEEQQEHLISQLQDQHFFQYMQQMMQSQLDPQQFYANQQLQQTTRSQTSESKPNQMNHLQESISTINLNNHNNREASNVSTSPYQKYGQHQHTDEDDNQVHSDVESHQLLNQIYPIGSRRAEVEKREEAEEAGEHRLEGEEKEEEGEEEGEEEEEHDEDGDYELTIAPPQMWTKKIIKSFKESIAKDSGDGIIKIGHGEVLTVSVPTHRNGSSIVWEFATDSYDIGFGKFFSDFFPLFINYINLLFRNR